MAAEMKLPQLGENVDAGVVLTVLVSPGEHVEKDQPILELESDKATAEVPADFTGRVAEIRVQEGDEIEGGQTILTYEDDDDEEARQEQQDEKKEHDEEEEEQAEREEEKEQDQRQAQDEEEEEKAEQDEQKREREPKQKKPAQSERKSRKPAEPRRSEPPTQQQQRAQQQRAQQTTARSMTPRIDEPVPAAPSIRQFARELGVAIEDVPGTGPGGRILEADVKSHVRDLLETLDERPKESPELPDFTTWGEVQREPMTAIRRAISENVSNSWEKIPHVSQFDRADITDLERFQERFQNQVAEDGGKLTVTSILLKVAAEALKTFPAFNSSLDLDRAELIEKEYVHIGVAVDTDNGLLVPVLRDVDKKGLARISSELGELANRARARKISREDLQGASFTLTNLGGLGTTHFTPIIGWPQVAILAVGRAAIEPVYKGGEFVPRRILPLGITYDHRAVDGADAARFLRWICETLEEPLRLTIGS